MPEEIKNVVTEGTDVTPAGGLDHKRRGLDAKGAVVEDWDDKKSSDKGPNDQVIRDAQREIQRNKGDVNIKAGKHVSEGTDVTPAGGLDHKRHGIDAVGKTLGHLEVPTTMAGLMASFKVMEGVDEDDIKEMAKMPFDKAKKAWKEAKEGKKGVKDIMSSYREEEQPPVTVVADPFKTSDVKLGESLGEIFAGQDLTEDFKTKAETLFEAVLNDRVDARVAVIEEEAKKEIETRVSDLKEALTVKMDAYLNRVVAEWVEENRIAVEAGLKTEITEDFMIGLKALFEEHNINIPASEESVLEETLKEKSELEEEVNSLLTKATALNEELLGYKKREVLATISEGLADTQREKLIKLAEAVDFKDETQYSEQVSIIKEHYFPKTKVVGETETQVDGVDIQKDVKVVPAHIAEAAKHIKLNATR